MKSFTRFSALVVAGLMMSVTAHAGVIGGVIGGDNTYNSGGAGGTGLGVGVGVGVGIGQGGNAVQGQQQGQQQGQVAVGQGGKGGSVSGSGNSQNSVTGIGGHANGNTQFDNSSQQSTATVSVQGDHYEAAKPGAATAYASNIYPTAPCMGSTSAGGQGSFFGFTFGTSWKDGDCSLREDVRTVSQVLNDPEMAREMFCQKNDAYRAAREAQGKPCGVKTVSAADGPQVIRAAIDTTYSGTRQDRVVNALARGEIIDDLARSRVGLPPLN